MGNANARPWPYTARYGWNWRSARAVGRALGSLALPMPPWLRMAAGRCLVTRTALRADAHGIWGSAWQLPAGQGGSVGSAGPCPWPDVTEIVVWQYDHLMIIGIARRGDTVGSGPAARALTSRAPGQSRPSRRRTLLRHPSYPAFIGPDGSPYDIGNVLTTNGWCVDTQRLRETVQHFAPRVRFTDLSSLTVATESGGLFAFPFEVLTGLLELIGWRRLGWLLGAAASTAVLVVAALNLGTRSHAAYGLVVGALALGLLITRALVVRRRRRGRRPENWLESGREDAGSSWLTRLRHGRLAAWTLRVSPPAGRRGRQGAVTSRRRSARAARRAR